MTIWGVAAFLFALVMGALFIFGKNGPGVAITIFCVIVFIGLPGWAIYNAKRKTDRVAELEASGFNASHKITVGEATLMFDDQARECVFVDATHSERFGYDQLRKLQYVYDPDRVGPPLTWTLTTLDPDRALYSWTSRGNQQQAEAWIAKWFAILHA